MNDNLTLRNQFESLRPSLNAWGCFVVDEIKKRVASRLPHGQTQLSSFFKVLPGHRVKDTESFLKKASKGSPPKYENPLVEINDMVGARFVVLLLKDIKIVKECILQEDCPWAFRVDRDFHGERENEPEKFSYQSVHIVLFAKQDFEHEVMNYELGVKEKVKIPQRTCCEVQIRTLMQHAYSELTHDEVYKPDFRVTPGIRRTVAQCMAMIETTDGLFDKAVNQIHDAKSLEGEVPTLIRDTFASLKGKPANGEQEGLFDTVLAVLLPLLHANGLRDLEQYLAERGDYLKDKVRQFEHSWQLLLLYAYDRDKEELRSILKNQEWGLYVFGPICIACGESPPKKL